MTSPRRRDQLARAQAARRQREQQDGLVRVLVKIHEKRRTELEDLVGEWMLEDLAKPGVADA